MGKKEDDKSDLGMIELVDSPFEVKRALVFLAQEKKAPPEMDPSADLSRDLFKMSISFRKPLQVGKQVFMDKINRPDIDLVQLRRDRKKYVEEKLHELFLEDMKPKYKRGWSVPVAGSYLDGLLHANQFNHKLISAGPETDELFAVDNIRSS